MSWSNRSNGWPTGQLERKPAAVIRVRDDEEQEQKRISEQDTTDWRRLYNELKFEHIKLKNDYSRLRSYMEFSLNYSRPFTARASSNVKFKHLNNVRDSVPHNPTTLNRVSDVHPAERQSKVTRILDKGSPSTNPVGVSLSNNQAEVRTCKHSQNGIAPDEHSDGELVNKNQDSWSHCNKPVSDNNNTGLRKLMYDLCRHEVREHQLKKLVNVERAITERLRQQLHLNVPEDQSSTSSS